MRALGSPGMGRAPSVKRVREATRQALSNCVEKTQRVDQALRRAKADESCLERLSRHSESEYAAAAERLRLQFFEDGVAMNSGTMTTDVYAATLSAEVRHLAEALQSATLKCEEAERRSSYGLYERWRRRLDRHLFAGGVIERSNTVEYLDGTRGYVHLDELTAAQNEESRIGQSCTHVTRELDDARRSVAALRAEVRTAESERVELWRQVAAQKQEYNRHWQEHLEHLPAYCHQLDGIRGMEAAIKDEEGVVQKCRVECEGAIQQEAVAAASLQKVRYEFREHELAAQRAKSLQQSAEAQMAELAAQAAWHPDEVERVDDMQRASQRLKRMQKFNKLCELESEEAKKTEARCALERQGLNYSLNKVKEELLDVRKHIELLRAQRVTSLRIFAEREDARQELLRVHADITLEHERQKLALASMNIPYDELEKDINEGFEDQGHTTARSLSPSSFRSVVGLQSPCQARSLSPGRPPGRRRAL